MDLSEIKKSLPDVKSSEKLLQLKELSDKRRSMDYNYREELSQLERKYHSLNKSIYDERKNLIRDVPCFWRTVFLNHPVLENIISEDDKLVLEHLVHVELVYGDQSPSFKLAFEFSENSYFENKVLTKDFTIINPNEPQYNDFIFENSQGTKIDWKNGVNICFMKSVKTQRNKKTGAIRKQEVEVPKASFFHFFGDVKYILSDETEEDSSEFEDNIEAEMEIAEIFKSTIIPDAHMWFFNEVNDDEGEDEDDYDFSDSEALSINGDSGEESHRELNNLPNKEQCRQQ